MASDSPESLGSETSMPLTSNEPSGGGAATGRDATPSVLAVVVAHEPGDHFEEVLESLGGQDYERLSVMVVDAAGTPGLEGRVGAILPDARVVRGATEPGFSAAANSILDHERGAAFLMLCHDDVALAPDAVRVMAVEALRSNAGVVGPKLVYWDEPDRLQHVGLIVDRFAVTAEVVEPGERDQEQHDAIVDVFAVPSACLLIRNDLFELLGGFDSAMTFRGEDVDICWRAQLAGARVVVVPDAAVRHRERLVERRGVDDVRRTRARHSLRSVLVNHGRISLPLVLVAGFLMSVGEALVALVTGRFGHVRDVFGAWTWNLGRLPDVVRRRRMNRRIRRARPADVVVSQHLGSVRVSAFVRGQIGRDGESGGLFSGAGRGLVASWRTGTTRAALLTWGLVVAFVLYGSRSLLTDGVPAVGDFVAFPESPGDLLSGWRSGWIDRDVGSPGSGLGGIGLLGVVSGLLLGATGLARTLWVIGPIFIGLVGIWRVLGVTGSRRAQMAALVAYLLVPLAFTSVSTASISGLIGYATSPWVLAGLLRLAAAPPFRGVGGPAWSFWAAGVGLGAVVGLAGAFEPAAAGLLPLTLLALLVGGVLAARPAGSLRMIAGAVVAGVVTATLTLPFVLDLFAVGASWEVVADGRDGDAGPHSLTELLTFSTGPYDPGVLVWALTVAALLPLVIGRSWRFELAVRCWSVAFAAWGLAFAAEWGAVGVGLPDVELLIAPAAAGVATSVGVSVTAVEHDLRFARFGWRQALLPLALAGAALAAIPAIGSLIDGRWGLARGDYGLVVPFEQSEESSYRVLWIGQPEFLPVQGRALDLGLAWAATLDEEPTVLDRNLPADPGAADLVETVVDDVLAGRTARVGRQLAGLGIRYVVLLDRLAPAPFSSAEAAVPVPDVVKEAFGDQLDLQRIEGINSAIEVFLNTVWVPVRAALPPGFDDGVEELADLERLPLGVGAGVLPGRGVSLSGMVPEGAEILVAQTPDAGWELSLDGQAVPRRRSVGWASAYLPPGGGPASLQYEAVWWRNLAQLVQVAVPLILLSAWLRRRLGGLR